MSKDHTPLLKKTSSSSSSEALYQFIKPNEYKAIEDKTLHYSNDDDFLWTEEEEQEVLSILDKYLMIFILLMTFVLNMDRTNICE